jgi:HEAT repeat protein
MAVLMTEGRVTHSTSRAIPPLGEVRADQREGRWIFSLALVLTVAGLLLPPSKAWASGQDATFQQLRDSVNSTEAGVRRKALKQLATMGAEALEPISLLVADPERGIRSDAILAVVGIYVQPPARKRVESAEDGFEWAEYRASPWPLPPALVPNLVRALSDDWPSIRRDAVYALGVVLPQPVDRPLGDELIYSLSDADRSVRLAAARALGRLRVASAGDLLIGRIVDPDLPVRLAAMRALGEIREGRAIAALRDQLEFYRGGSAGRAALEALARIAHPSTAGLLAEARLSGDERIRRYGYEGLARLGGVPEGEAIAVERLLTEEHDAGVIGAITFALAAAGRPYVDRIVQALADDNTADQALGYLVELGHDHPDVLLPHLQNAVPVVRERVAIAVGFTGGPDAEAALSALTRDGDPAVRRAAEMAIMRMRAPKRP